MDKIKYEQGQPLGPHGIPYLADAPSYISPKGQKNRRAVFQCKCGEPFIAQTGGILSGNTTNCGCGAISGYKRHGLTGTKISMCWHQLVRRCLNPKGQGYKNYGGRGITVYPPWVNDPKAFYAYVVTLPGWDDPTLTLDRIDNDGNYEPGNLRWATWETQANNRRPQKAPSSSR